MVSNMAFLQKLMLTITIDGILEKHAKIHYHNIYISDKIDEAPICSPSKVYDTGNFEP